jgi:hypothetical protein
MGASSIAAQAQNRTSRKAPPKRKIVAKLDIVAQPEPR